MFGRISDFYQVSARPEIGRFWSNSSPQESVIFLFIIVKIKSQENIFIEEIFLSFNPLDSSSSAFVGQHLVNSCPKSSPVLTLIHCNYLDDKKGATPYFYNLFVVTPFYPNLPKAATLNLVRLPIPPLRLLLSNSLKSQIYLNQGFLSF